MGWGDYAGGGWNCLAALGEAQGRWQAWPYGGLLIEGEQGRHKACPYRSVGDFGDDYGGGGGGQAQGLPLQDRLGDFGDDYGGGGGGQTQGEKLHS
ncbi:MAG: hypothetical protein OXC27_13450 [Caldilineaceae bacterium]|nr:hypothetical protein [Caldilineaceae bacterium]